MRYVFAGFEARTNGFELRREDEQIGLEPKPLRLLLHLLSRAPEPVSVEELFAVLWPGETVTRSSLSQAVRLARRALGGQGPSIIQTVRGRGYRIGVAVERLAEAAPTAQWTTQDAFVGRASTLDRLDRDVEAALAGSPRTILIAGEPGIGKTRTIEALCASERLADAEVVWGRCFEGTGSLPLQPWLKILRQLVRARSADTIRELLGAELTTVAAVSEDVRALTLDTDPRLSLDADQHRFRLLEACAAFFQALGRERPLVLMLDDLHHANALSLALWEHVAREATHTRLLLVGAYRHVAALPNPPLEKMVAATAQLPSAGGALTLEGLEPSEVGDLLEAVAGSRPPADFVERAYERTAGNPLFVRSLSWQGYDEPIPESVRRVVRDRLFLLERRGRRGRRTRVRRRRGGRDRRSHPVRLPGGAGRRFLGRSGE
jgi:DNA-binding winged helix-turn-helix (wHTH) protein